MELSKFDIDFKEWLITEYYGKLSKSLITAKLNAISFPNRKIEEQFGVHDKFARTHDYELVAFKWGNKNTASVYKVDNDPRPDIMVWNNEKSKTKEQAYEKCINKFKEIYNEKFS